MKHLFLAILLLPLFANPVLAHNEVKICKPTWTQLLHVKWVAANHSAKSIGLTPELITKVLYAHLARTTGCKIPKNNK